MDRTGKKSEIIIFLENEEEKMQTVTQILEHLQKLPEEFAEQYAAGEYARAASTHEYAARVSSFIEMDKDARDALMVRFDQVQVEDAYQRVGRWRDAERERVGKEAFRAGGVVRSLNKPARVPAGCFVR